MGMYAIPCKTCGKQFMWFSGFMDQRCGECQKAAEDRKKLADSQASDAGVKDE
jgi:hypothetical protein